jgi:hypothetical protein
MIYCFRPLVDGQKLSTNPTTIYCFNHVYYAGPKPRLNFRWQPRPAIGQSRSKSLDRRSRLLIFKPDSSLAQAQAQAQAHLDRLLPLGPLLSVTSTRLTQVGPLGSAHLDRPKSYRAYSDQPTRIRPFPSALLVRPFPNGPLGSASLDQLTWFGPFQSALFPSATSDSPLPLHLVGIGPPPLGSLGTSAPPRWDRPLPLGSLGSAPSTRSPLTGHLRLAPSARSPRNTPRIGSLGTAPTISHRDRPPL